MSKEPEQTRSDKDFKSTFDFLKHLTTLSSGAILIIFAMWERLEFDAKQENALTFAVFSFLIAIVCSSVDMGMIAFKPPSQGWSESEIRFFSWTLTMTAIGFIGGMALISVSILGR